MNLLKEGKTNWKYILIIVILAVIVGVGIFWLSKKEIPITQFYLSKITKEISEQKALELANQTVQSKCGTRFTEIEKVDWTPGGPGFDILKESICPSIENYKEKKIWNAYKKLINGYWISVLVGLDGKLVCVSSSIAEAAPGGPLSLDKACPSDETVNWKIYRNDDYGFEIKYPDDWPVSMGFCSTVDWGSPRGCIRFVYEKDQECAFYIGEISKAEYDNLLKPGEETGKEEILLDQIKITVIKRCCQVSTLRLFSKDNKYFAMQSVEHYVSPHRNPAEPFPPSCPYVEGKMLSTFRFLE